MRLRQACFSWLSALILGVVGSVCGQSDPGIPDDGIGATNRPSVARPVVIRGLNPVSVRDFFTRPGAGFAVDMNLFPPAGSLTFLPGDGARSLVCGIQDTGSIRVLPLCQSRFELLPSLSVFAPEGVPGLRGEYYPGTKLRGRLGAVRIDPNVDFNWGTESPVEKMAATNFSARWSGYIKMDREGECRFTVLCDGGTRLWVDGQLVINDWTSGGLRQRTGRAWMTDKRRHSISLDYFHETGPAQIQLAWNWGLFTAAPEDIKQGKVTPQSSEWKSDSGYSVRWISPFTDGEVLDPTSFASQCQVVPAFGMVLTVTNSSPTPQTMMLLCGLDRPIQKMDGTNWSGIAYSDSKSNGTPALVLSTATGPTVLRELNWQAAGETHGMFIIPCEVPAHQTVSRVFWISKYEDGLSGTSQRPFYTKCWTNNMALLDWLAAHGGEVLEATDRFDAKAVTPGMNLDGDAFKQWRAWCGSFGLSADVQTQHLTLPFSGNSTNQLESHFTPEWLKKLQTNHQTTQSLLSR